ncbi:MAG: hypothetical protein IJ503_02075, partial [Akkermansia sp.]|nr:hypothetical protein [Akkermansia sp.]
VQDPCISKQNSSVTPQVCGVHISFFIPTTGSVRVAHYTCGYFSVARSAGLNSFGSHPDKLQFVEFSDMPKL